MPIARVIEVNFIAIPGQHCASQCGTVTEASKGRHYTKQQVRG